MCVCQYHFTSLHFSSTSGLVQDHVRIYKSNRLAVWLMFSFRFVWLSIPRITQAYFQVLNPTCSIFTHTESHTSGDLNHAIKETHYLFWFPSSLFPMPHSNPFFFSFVTFRLFRYLRKNDFFSSCPRKRIQMKGKKKRSGNDNKRSVKYSSAWK